MNLLLMSSSRSATTDFLEANTDELADILRGVKRALFIPYAVIGEVRESGMGFVHERVKQFGVDLENIDAAVDAVEAVNRADAILVSGGNTFCLLKELYDGNLVEPIRNR
ncbi:MAG: Type 1 glutamine amidotransferase-like domain-containing protein, partial [Proteobacteria bacterium]|nr:Type 1 glutamine amidotransferase-like domain-containing protein [Pseudomonadota bacterium]